MCESTAVGARSSQPQRLREHAIEAKADWEELDEIAFSRLGALQIEPPEAEDLCVLAALPGGGMLRRRGTDRCGRPRAAEGDRVAAK